MQSADITWIVIDRLPERLARLLRDAHAAETAAVGADRRSAWRTTRQLLGGAIAAGYPPRLLASCLGLGLDSIRTRAARDAWLPAAAIIGIGGIDAADLPRWRADGLLPAQRRLPDGTGSYPAADIVRAIIASEPSRTGAQQLA